MGPKNRSKDPVANLADMMGGAMPTSRGPAPQQQPEQDDEEAAYTAKMEAVLTFVQSPACGIGDIFEAQALLLACVGELTAQMKEDFS